MFRDPSVNTCGTASITSTRWCPWIVRPTSRTTGRTDSDFDQGIELALGRILASPKFIYRIETEPAAALRSIQLLRIKVAVGRWSAWAHEPIFVSSTISRDGDIATGMSTLAREMAFVLNHTIHHQATIGLLASLQGCGVPDGFGYAPSTPRPAAQRGC